MITKFSETIPKKNFQRKSPKNISKKYSQKKFPNKILTTLSETIPKKKDSYVWNSENLYICSQDKYKIVSDNKKCDEIGIKMTCQHYIHGWCNIFEKGDSIEWHSHCEKNLPNMYHGVFCVDPAGESFTEYRYNDTKEVYSSIKSIAGQGHFICDMITEHRSTQNESNEPRITIAFDIVDLSNYQRHWDTPNGNQFIPFIQ